MNFSNDLENAGTTGTVVVTENLTITELKQSYTELNMKYLHLQKKHKELVSEYSENTIILSMNDMKKEYEYLETQNKKIKKLNMKYFDTMKTIKIMIESIIKTLTSNNDLEFENDYLMLFIYQLKMKLKFITEVMDNSNETLYDLF